MGHDVGVMEIELRALAEQGCVGGASHDRDQARAASDVEGVEAALQVHGIGAGDESQAALLRGGVAGHVPADAMGKAKALQRAGCHDNRVVVPPVELLEACRNTAADVPGFRLRIPLGRGFFAARTAGADHGGHGVVRRVRREDEGISNVLGRQQGCQGQLFSRRIREILGRMNSDVRLAVQQGLVNVPGKEIVGHPVVGKRCREVPVSGCVEGYRVEVRTGKQGAQNRQGFLDLDLGEPAAAGSYSQRLLAHACAPSAMIRAATSARCSRSCLWVWTRFSISVSPT